MFLRTILCKLISSTRKFQIKIENITAVRLMATPNPVNTIKIETPADNNKKQSHTVDNKELKEVKKKDVSQSRQKRFHRLFQHVDQDEEIIDCKLGVYNYY